MSAKALDRLLDLLVDQLVQEVTERVERQLMQRQNQRQRRQDRAAATVPLPAETNGHALLTMTEASDMLRISRAHLYEMVGTDQIPTVRNGRRRFLRRADVEAYMLHAS
jgi:excisionase family DNA binding protein